MEAYCLKCKQKREINAPQAGFTSRGTPMTTGTCPVCGTRLFKMGNTPAHEGLEKPDIEKKALKVKKVTRIAVKGNSKKAKTGAKPKTQASQAVKGSAMSGSGKPLVVVESPAKARTIGRFLGKDYHVLASVGHVRDLLKTQLSVDVEHDFAPKYRVPDEKKALVREIKGLAERSPQVYLATDPDREGESIAWHLMDSAEINPAKVQRVVFHEITREAIADAFAHPRQVDMDLVNAQQSRRILDRLVGYGMSPILWAKVRGRLSAGRVQSVALRLIVEREREIQGFVPTEYWMITATLEPNGSGQTYGARLIKINGKDPVLPDEKRTLGMVADMRAGTYLIDTIKKSERKIKPQAPFITSTLQQETSRKLGFLTKKTMAVAQQLYEGIDIGNGEATGLITYMRTDSVHVAPQALNEAREYIRNKFGPSYLPEKSPVYRTRAASAQEAHEAIRPTLVNRVPEEIKPYLSNDQYRLYKLIWQRFVSSQMESAVQEITTVEITGKTPQNSYQLRSGTTLTKFPGFRALYQETQDEDEVEKEDLAELPLKYLAEGQVQSLRDLDYTQHFTQPPPRFTEASLIQVLEENKIGRPSTYSPIITNIQTRGYVSREDKRLYPTEIGITVNDLVVEYFPSVVDIGFTSEMEDRLDEIAKGKLPWVEVIRDFYGPFEKSLENARENMPETRIQPEKIGRACPECGHDLVLRTGRFGKFISCSAFPKCKYTEPWLEKIGVNCPKCKTGEVVEKRSKKGRLFYGCSRYPDCDFTSWNRPVKEKCPNCGGTLVMANRHQAKCLDCNAVVPFEDGETAK